MIEIKEIRQGNYLRRRTSTEIIEVKDTDTYIRISRCPQIYSPVSLTEEWLLEFGFIKGHDSTPYYYSKGSPKIFRVQFSGYMNGDEGFQQLYLNNKSWLRIKYVHQLQNVYHALTNQELTLK